LPLIYFKKEVFGHTHVFYLFKSSKINLKLCDSDKTWRFWTNTETIFYTLWS